jgi:hypothetical protein
MASHATLPLSALKWSSQLAITSPIRTPKLPGDKILLPQSALEQLLAAAPVAEEGGLVDSAYNTTTTSSSTFDPFNPHTFAAEAQARAAAASGLRARQPQLPHPLTFRITNPGTGRAVYAGIREFSAEEGQVSLSSFLREALGLEESADGGKDNDGGGATMDIDSSSNAPTVTVDVQQLPKGTYVRLRPLEAGYESEDWKALLERHLRENFTTLTIGEILTIPRGRNRYFKFLVDKASPEGSGICIVDTDLEVDMEPLNEEQARETLRRQAEKASIDTKTKKGSSLGGVISSDQDISGRVARGEYVDYELRDWNSPKGIQLQLEAADGAELDIFVSPFTPYQRSRPRSDEHVFGDMSSSSSKSIKLDPSTPEFTDAETLYISVHAFLPPGDENDPNTVDYVFRISEIISDDSTDQATTSSDHDPEETQCKNCLQWVPKRTLFLHENFCLRNNVFCPKCQNVFQKSSSEWQNHWHCEHDEYFGNDVSSKERHDSVFHESHFCPNCDYEASNLPSLAHHRTTRCPSKLILCQFCHLVVPQQSDTDPDMNDPEVLLSGLAPHEVVDGGRTTECHLCSKIIRLREMKTHLRHHDLERLSRPPPSICRNENCGRTVKPPSTTANASRSSLLGLCTICFGPLYTDTHDPEGKALKRRIERRYLSQMLTGCGKSWCHNEYCKTGHPRSSSTTNLPTSSKEILQITKPLLDAINLTPASNKNTAPFYFCADETSQHRRLVGELIAAEGVYDIGWCLAALEAAGGDLEKAREWLNGWAPKKNETRAT